MKTNRFFLAVIFSFCFSVPSLQADDSSLQIRVSTDQDSIKAGMMFLAEVQVVNSSPDATADFWSNTCSYEKHWVTDNPGVFIQSWTCSENALEPITLAPGDSYQKNIILYIPKKDKTEPVSFRLGFKRMSENGDVAEPLWSDPVTMRVIVPEPAKDAPPPAPAISETPGQAPEIPESVEAKEENVETAGETNGTAQPEPPAVPVSPTPVADPSLVFQDSSVPIKVAPNTEFSISLASNPSTGFRWKMTLPEDQKFVQFLGSEHVVSQEVMPGVPGTEVFKFKALSAGGTNVDFVYHRPWETVTAPTRKVFTIVVQEN